MIASTRPLATKFRPIYSSKGRWGNSIVSDYHSLLIYDKLSHNNNQAIALIFASVGTMVPRKQVNEDGGDQAGIEKGNAEPIVTFSRPPPLPPVLGSLVAISVLESLNKGDNKED
ncbi:hypothetical protein SASPL_143238 [Salvia splendens]|uniref:Uncharacterized protein n=1 Tax=Salvia splendens TaxID=180675 RepID=A0A8X8Z9K0_SALSN|nr:hypothetical protein SASPL_143238 [Salvia splendens]